MKKHILCFGDSNTHGYCADPADNADGGIRFNENERWTKLLQEKLVTFIGSDAHRTVHLASGVQYICETCDEDYAADVCWRNAERLLL